MPILSSSSTNESFLHHDGLLTRDRSSIEEPHHIYCERRAKGSRNQLALKMDYTERAGRCRELPYHNNYH